MQGATSDPKVAGSLVEYKDGKVNGIPVWVWILVSLLVVSVVLLVSGAFLSYTVVSSHPAQKS